MSEGSNKKKISKFYFKFSHKLRLKANLDI